MAESSLEAQARRALESAEQRFLAGDIAGARRYAQYALSLAPGLHGAEQALVAYDVHAAAPDWYAVLGLPHPRRPSGDRSAVVVTHDDIKRQHRRLCLLVHPDKNPSAAADGAFKIVQAAYADAMRAAEAAARTAWEEQAAVSRFWQAAANDVTMPAASAPKQPPIARPPPRWAAPAPGPPRQPPSQSQPPSWAQGVQTPQRAPAPSNLGASRPTMPGKPSCPYYPLCVHCRLYASTATMSGKKPHCSLYPYCECCRF